nr:hypothetical protein [Tanacetum cinerariifolium]
MAGDDNHDGDTTPPVSPPIQQISYTVSSIKLPILKKGEYDIWLMKMGHYLSHTDYPIWQVIQNGNGPVSVTTYTNGMIKVLPPKTTKEVVAREKERKSKTTLLMALPEDHLAKFHKMVDAKEMWEAIESRFSGNDESKKMQKYLLKQQFEGFSVSTSEGRPKGFDDPYNVAFVFAKNTSSTNDVKGTTASSSNTQNVAFVFAKNTSSTNDGTKTTEEEILSTMKTKLETMVEDLYQDDSKALVTIDGEDIDWSGHVEEDAQNYAMMAYSSSNSGSDNEVEAQLLCHQQNQLAYEQKIRLLNTQMSANDKFGLGYGDYRYGSILSYENEVLQTVPPPMTGNYMPFGPDVEIDYSKFTYGLKQTSVDELDSKSSEYVSYESDSSVETSTSMPEPIENASKVICEPKVWTDAPIIKEYKSDIGNDSVSNVQEDKEKPSFAFTDSVKHVKTSRKNVKESGTPNHSPKIEKQDRNGHTRKGLGYAFTRKSCFVCGSFSHLIRDCDFHEKGWPNKLNSPKARIRHMTGNKAYLADYHEFKGGSVAFKGGTGRITGKGKIKAGMLDFKDVYYVEELKHYNLFSLPDENQVLLKIPRQHNMYSFNFKNIDPSGNLACLFVKALIDESNKWHRRLGHVNFKNLNKLVKGNLVRGQPSKIFENDHTYVACQKGKQHKASYKAKTVSSVNQPLQILHMDLFGPTTVRSINHKTYCLVVTDGFRKFSWVYFLRSKDETTPILKDFIRQAENQFNHKVKTIRSDNGTEFKNHEELYGLKGIKREYSNARTPQQNKVADRKSRTLIEAARTMVLVTKPQNKTPCELLSGKQPIISYLRPFGCHVTILNTINQLGKFDGKSDSGFFVRYSLNNKAFRVYNLETKRVEENLYVNFLENKPNVVGKGNAWMFDLDYLTKSINYKPVLVENQANKFVGPKEANNNAGTQANDDQSANSEEIDLHEEHFVLPIWSAYSTTVKSSGDKIEKNTYFKSCEKPVSQVEQIFLEELKKLKRQEKEANHAAEPLRKEATRDIQNANTSSTNLLNTVSTPLSTAGPLRTFNVGEPSYPDDPLMPHLEDIYASPSEGIFTDLSYDDEGVVTDFNNLETTVNVSPTPTTRIHTIHPKTQILGDHMSDVQIRSKVNKNSEAHALNVWILVDLPFGKKAIRTKWVYRNKKDKKGVVVRNKARLVAQGHRQEEEIDYDKVFAHVDRIEAIQIFLAFASYMGFIVYQMDVKSAFLLKTASTPTETHKPLVKDKEAADVDVYLYRFMIGSLMYLNASRPDIMFAFSACSRFQVTPKTSHLQAVKRIFRYLKGQPKLAGSESPPPMLNKENYVPWSSRLLR